MRYFFRIMPAIISLFAIFGCTTPGNQPVAMATMAAAVKSGVIKDGKAHVHAFLGTVCTPTNFFVNGVNVGGINRNECMFIELPPGTYTFSCQERASSLSSASKPVTFALEADQNVFFAFDVRFNPGVLFGVVGVMATSGSADSAFLIVDRSADGIETIQNMKIVLPDKAD